MVVVPPLPLIEPVIIPLAPSLRLIEVFPPFVLIEPLRVPTSCLKLSVSTPAEFVRVFCRLEVPEKSKLIPLFASIESVSVMVVFPPLSSRVLYAVLPFAELLPRARVFIVLVVFVPLEVLPKESFAVLPFSPLSSTLRLFPLMA